MTAFAPSSSASLPMIPTAHEQRRQIFRILDEVSSFHPPADYKPQTVIRAVNALQPLGKQRALDTIDEYLEENYGAGIFLVLRVLFEVPASQGCMPQMSVGDFGAPTPQLHPLLSRSPIVLYDDIPFLLGGRFFFGSGVFEGPEAHARYFRKHGTLRAKPLSPAKRPAKSLGRLIRALEKKGINFNEEDMTKQAQSMVGPAHRFFQWSLP